VPLYEYRCREGHNTEVFHPIADRPVIACEVCRAPTERVLSPPMIHTQYYFSPQVHGARKPRYRPPSTTGPAETPPGPPADRRRRSQKDPPKPSS
jgi:putative FmdB family regulatory protein